MMSRKTSAKLDAEIRNILARSSGGRIALPKPPPSLRTDRQLREWYWRKTKAAQKHALAIAEVQGVDSRAFRDASAVLEAFEREWEWYGAQLEQGDDAHATKIDLRDLDLLAQAASFGEVSVEDIVPSPRRTARLSPSNIKRSRAARRRLNSLVERDLLKEGFGDRFVATSSGKAALVAAGFAPNRAGSWLRPDGRVPGWAL